MVPRTDNLKLPDPIICLHLFNDSCLSLSNSSFKFLEAGNERMMMELFYIAILKGCNEALDVLLRCFVILCDIVLEFVACNLRM